MSDLSIRKTAVLLGVQIFGVLVLGELLASLLIFIFVGVVTPAGLNQDLWTLLFVAVIIKVFVQGYLILLMAANWTSNRYLIRGHHLVMRHRLLSQDDKLYELSNLQNIHVHQSWLGRLCNFGTLELAFAMPGHVYSLFLHDVHNPRHYVGLFEKFFAGPGGAGPQSQHMLNPPTQHDPISQPLPHSGAY